MNQIERRLGVVTGQLCETPTEVKQEANRLYEDGTQAIVVVVPEAFAESALTRIKAAVVSRFTPSPVLEALGKERCTAFVFGTGVEHLHAEQELRELLRQELVNARRRELAGE